MFCEQVKNLTKCVSDLTCSSYMISKVFFCTHGRPPRNDPWTIIAEGSANHPCRTAFLRGDKRERSNKNCKDFPTVLIIKEARMKPLTFKPFINLAEAIALAKETGKPVLVKP